jgi:HK97 family phage major capsid protein
MQEISPIAVIGWAARKAAIASRGYAGDGDDWLAAHAPRAIVERIKAPIGAADSSVVPPYGISVGSWSDAARNRSVFYRLLADGAFVRTPFHVAVGMVVGTTSGALVTEGAAAPVGRITLGNTRLEPQKAISVVVTTMELLRDVSAAGQQLFNRELLGAVSDAVDGAFLAQMIDTASPAIASTAPRADLRAALAAVSTVGAPRLYWVASQSVAELGSTLSTTVGGFPFQACTPTGGELCGLPMMISGGIPAGELALINAAAIAADGAVPVVDVSSQADVKMDSVPPMNSVTPAATTMTSMFQSNSVALRAVAVFGCEKLRADAVSVITGISGTTWVAT